MAFVCSLTAKEYGELNALKARIFRYLKSFFFSIYFNFETFFILYSIQYNRLTTCNLFLLFDFKNLKIEISTLCLPFGKNINSLLSYEMYIQNL